MQHMGHMPGVRHFHSQRKGNYCLGIKSAVFYWQWGRGWSEELVKYKLFGVFTLTVPPRFFNLPFLSLLRPPCSLYSPPPTSRQFEVWEPLQHHAAVRKKH